MVKDFGAKKIKTSLQEDVGRYYFTVFEFISANKNIFFKKIVFKSSATIFGDAKQKKKKDVGNAGRI